MKYDIAESHADLEVLLTTLTGDHRQNKSDRRANLITGILAGAALIWAAFSDWGEGGTANERLGALALALAGLVFPLAMWIRGLTQYTFSPQSIARRNPLWPSWQLAAADIQRVALELRDQWVMIVTTTAGRRRRIPVVESMSTALASLYPEQFGPSQPVQLPKRLGYAMYALLAAAILAFVVLLVILSRRGLVQWW